MKSIQRKASSGVVVSDHLRHSFRSAYSTGSNARYMTVTVLDDTLELVRLVTKSSSRWESDFDGLSREFSDSAPLFIVFWKDYATEERRVHLGNPDHDAFHGHVHSSKVILMLYNPDGASARDRMRFGAAWPAMRELCGLGVDEYQGSTREDFTWKSYRSVREPVHGGVLEQGSTEELLSADHKSSRGGLNVLAVASGASGAVPRAVLESVRQAGLSRGEEGGVTHPHVTTPSQYTNK
jgi:hypothetical protein